MKIWFARHGQTRLNRMKLMQGLTDEPLNETGISQAREMRSQLLEIYGDLRFDAVFSSPLKRARTTGAILSGFPEEEIVTDPRLIEADFGKYEGRKYYLLGLPMTLYWTMPEIFPAPPTVETIASMVSRSSSFLEELISGDLAGDCGNVLVACHGGILRALSGYMEERPKGIAWRPKPRNVEVRIYEAEKGKRRLLRRHLPE